MLHKIEKDGNTTTHYFLASQEEVSEYFRKVNDMRKPSFWDALAMVFQGNHTKSTITYRWDYANKNDWHRYWRIRALIEEEKKS